MQSLYFKMHLYLLAYLCIFILNNRVDTFCVILVLPLLYIMTVLASCLFDNARTSHISLLWDKTKDGSIPFFYFIPICAKKA